MKRRIFVITAAAAIGSVGLVTVGCTTTGPDAPADREAKRREIESGADGALTRLYGSARSAKELSQRAEGILVFPRVVSGGFIVGGQYGDGVLRSRGKPHGYYRIAGGSFGFLAGAQSQAVVLMFITPAVLQGFLQSSGWTAGVDATVSIATVGATGEIDTNTAKQSIIGFAMTNAGLYAGLKLDGAKITRLDL